MKTFVLDLISKIQNYSKKIDDLSLLQNQHWIFLNEIDKSKQVFIFRSNKELLISVNGIVEKGKWDYVGNKSLFIESNNQNLLLRHGFLDEDILLLKIDSTDNFLVFINESKFSNEINTVEDVYLFLKRKYLYKTNISKEVNFKERQKEWIKNPDFCPGCGFKGVNNLSECPDCGLNLD